MRKSDGKPLPPQVIDSATFVELATKAMRRAQRVAEKENARYGMKLVLEQPRPSSRKGLGAVQLRRVEKRVESPVVS